MAMKWAELTHKPCHAVHLVRAEENNGHLKSWFISLSLLSQSTAALDANREKSKGLFRDLPQHIKQNQDEGKKSSRVK